VEYVEVQAATLMAAVEAPIACCASLAEIYADQNERDYAALQAAVQSGRITAITGL